MKVALSVALKDKKANGGYVSMSDDGTLAERTLCITDDAGNIVTLKNEQIGELYRAIKPGLVG